MTRLPPLDLQRRINHAPHVVLLGAGASLAACPEGDLNRRQLPLMRTLVDTVGIRGLLDSHGIRDGQDDFEGLYTGLVQDRPQSELLHALETRIREYFEAIVLPDRATLYDQLLLSLREKDVIASFNWDPLLAQAFRRNRSVAILPQMLFLHGNVDITACREHRRSGFPEQSCEECGSKMERVPLLYPVGQKDYSKDPFIAAQWDQLRDALGRAYLVTIIGYSAPATDQVARSLLLEAWHGNPSTELASVQVVDVRVREEVEDAWSDFFVNPQLSGVVSRASDTWLFHHARRSCESFAWATLQQAPWPECPVPSTSSLNELHAWLAPFIRQEADGRLSGDPVAEP